MHVERYGSGDAIYFGLHGWGGGSRTFAPLIRYLPEGATFYSADLPGYGESPAPGEWKLSAIVEETASAILAIGARKVTVIGNCSGAILGLLAVRQAIDRSRDAASNNIGRLVLIDPFAYMPWYFKVFVASSFGKYAYYSTFANPVGRWLTNLSLRGRRTKDSDLTNTFSRVNHTTVYRHLSLLTEVESIEPFRDLNLPIDIAYGERTFSAVKRSITLWQSIWPHARCRELKGAGHLPIEEATEQLSEIVFRPIA